MKKIYFKRLFLAFLFASIFPICFCVLSIAYGSFRISKDRYEGKAGEAAAIYSGNVEEMLEEYERILNSQSALPALRDSLKEGRYEALKELMKPLQTGRENRIQIRIVSRKNGQIYPDSREAALYRPAVYSGWGLLYEMERTPDQIVIFPNSTRAGGEKSVCLNMGKAVVDQSGNVVGYMVLDIYRNTLLGAVKYMEGDPLAVVLSDEENSIIVLDTTGFFKEGTAGKPGDKRGNTIVAGKDNSYGLRLHVYYDISEFNENIRMVVLISLLVLGVMTALSFLLAAFFANRMYRPIETLVNSMTMVTEGNLNTKIEMQKRDSDEMRLVSSVFNWMTDRIQELIDNAREESERKKDAQLKALQAQISPHFLYNMLNEINALARMGRTSEISEFVIHLGRLLRRSIAFKDDFVRLSDDLVFVEDYIRLQQIRYDQLFSVDIQVAEEVKNCLIPNLIIQPLVENAIVHGFTADRKDYKLSILGYETDDKIYLEIFDNGIGVKTEYLSYINDVEKGAGLYGGLGVENVQKRLFLLYGLEYGLKMESEEGSYTKVLIVLPDRRGPE